MAYSQDNEPFELTELTSLETGDAFIVGDADDSSEVAKYITKANLITDLGIITASSTTTLTNKTIDGDNNTISNLDLGNEVNWAAADDVTTASAFESGDKLLAFEAGVGMRKIDYDDLPSGGGGGTLDQSYDTGGSGSGRSITADSGAVAVTVPDTSDNTALELNQNDSTNNPAALAINQNGSGNSILITSTSAGTQGPTLITHHNSASPAAADTVGEWLFRGEDSASNITTYGGMSVLISDTTNSSEDGYFAFKTIQGGTLANRLLIGESINGISVGSGGAAGVIESTGSYDLILQTGNSTTGNITITDGADGNINIAPNGSGEAQVGGEQILTESMDLVPSADSTYDLGSSSNYFAEGYIDSLNVKQTKGTAVSLGNLGTTEVIDWATGTYFYGTLDDNVTITHSNEAEGQSITIVLTYDGSAQRNITWSHVDEWAQGSAPTAPSTTDKETIVTLLFVNSTCYGFHNTAVAAGGGGDAWSDAVDADIVPDTDSSRDLGSTSSRFAEGYVDALTITDSITNGGYIDFSEISTPSDPSANVARFYSKDDGGTTKLYFRDSAGSETEIGSGGASDHGNLTGLTDDDHTQYPVISSGAGSPSTTPARVGAMYVDTTNNRVFFGFGTTNYEDWRYVATTANPFAPDSMAYEDGTNNMIFEDGENMVYEGEV